MNPQVMRQRSVRVMGMDLRDCIAAGEMYLTCLGCRESSKSKKEELSHIICLYGFYQNSC